MSVLRIIWGIGAILAGAYAALGIWLPNLRANWGGPFSGRAKADSDRIRAGSVSSAGFGLLFISLGLGSLSGREASPKLWGVVLLAGVFAGFFLIIAGWLIDSRAHDTARKVYRLPGETPITTQERDRWIGAACAVLILVLIILVLLFHG
jgi:hypothetical protein